MSQIHSGSRAPAEETWVHKTDNIDWSVVTRRACELEFRADYEFDLPTLVGVTAQVIAHLSLASLIAWLLLHPVAIWIAPLFDFPGVTLMALSGGVAGAVCTALTHCERDAVTITAFLHPRTLRIALLPPVLCQAMAGVAHVHLLAGAVSYYFFAALPIAMLAFDRFATHAVRWLTASATTHYAKRVWGRRIWSRRIWGACDASSGPCAEMGVASDPRISAVRSACTAYRWGVFWVYGATLVPLLLHARFFADAPRTVLGLQLLLGTFFGLVAAVTLRSGGDLRIIPRFLQVLIHWFYYGWNDRLLPWIFRSPCGRCLRRQAYLLISVGLLSVPMTSLAAHSLAGLLAAPPESRTQPSMTQLSPVDVNPYYCLLFAADHARSPLWIGPTVVVALVMAPLNFCLIGILLTGRLISAYQDAFELPMSTPPVPVFPEDADPDSAPEREGSST